MTTHHYTKILNDYNLETEGHQLNKSENAYAKMIYTKLISKVITHHHTGSTK